MKVLVTASARFAITDDGILWTQNASLGYQFWAQYLDVYHQVHLLARAKLYPEPPPGWIQASGAGVKAVPVPYFVGPWEFIQKYAVIKQAIAKALADVEAEAIILRGPCTIGDEISRLLPPQRPYGIEVVADPYDIFAPGAVKHPLRPFFRWWFTRTLKQHCARADAALYVTKQALQQRYPCPNYAVGVSDVDLCESMLVATPRSFTAKTPPLTLITVGSLDQLYKAPDVLIQAVATCVAQGLDINLVLVGDGHYRPTLEKQATNLGIGNRVNFCGQLPNRDAVQQQLDRADLFILPSHQEGLPKAMVEAMAQALPCIGSTVGGFPELLTPADMIPPGDVTALAEKIREVVTDSQRMAQMSARNLDIAKNYTKKVLQEQRIDFYRYVKKQTESWWEINSGTDGPKNREIMSTYLVE